LVDKKNVCTFAADFRLCIVLFMTDIFKIRTLGVCKKVQLDEKTAFNYYDIPAGDAYRKRDLPLNFILFVLEGGIEISCNRYEKRLVQPDEMILLVRSSSVQVSVLKATALIVMYFDGFLSSCDQILFHAYYPDAEKISYEFAPMRVPNPILQFLSQMRCLIEQKVGCMHFNCLKHREFFILLRHFCSREDLVKFLSPLIGRSMTFRNKVLEKFALVKNGGVSELASLVGMGRKNFDRQFRKEFDISPAKWLLQEKSKRLYMYLMEPEVTISDAIDMFNFNSSAHFNRFCQQYFKTTPGAIIKEARNKQNIKDDVPPK